MARKASTKKDVASATLPSGTKVTASQEVIDKLVRSAPRKASSAQAK